MTLTTGRVRNHDQRSRQYATAARLTRPRSVRHFIGAAPLDQGNLSACTGFAAAQWLNCGRNAYSRKLFNHWAANKWLRTYTDDDDGRLLYSLATSHDDFEWAWPTDDLGSSGLGVAKALKARNIIDRYEWTFTFTTFLAALQIRPVLIGTAWTTSMFDPDSRGIIRPTGSLDGDAGHEYLGVGINWPRKLIRIRNSWNGWGIDGDAYIPFYDMERLLAAGGDVVIPIQPLELLDPIPPF